MVGSVPLKNRWTLRSLAWTHWRTIATALRSKYSTYSRRSIRESRISKRYKMSCDLHRKPLEIIRSNLPNSRKKLRGSSSKTSWKMANMTSNWLSHPSTCNFSKSKLWTTKIRNWKNSKRSMSWNKWTLSGNPKQKKFYMKFNKTIWCLRRRNLKEILKWTRCWIWLPSRKKKLRLWLSNCNTRPEKNKLLWLTQNSV